MLHDISKKYQLDLEDKLNDDKIIDFQEKLVKTVARAIDRPSLVEKFREKRDTDGEQEILKKKRMAEENQRKASNLIKNSLINLEFEEIYKKALTN